MFRCLRASAALLRNRLAPLDPTIPLRFMVPPSYGAEGGTGSRRRQPSASAANENKIAILLIIKGIAIAFVIENYYLVVAKKTNNSIKQWQR